MGEELNISRFRNVVKKIGNVMTLFRISKLDVIYAKDRVCCTTAIFRAGRVVIHGADHGKKKVFTLTVEPSDSELQVKVGALTSTLVCTSIDVCRKAEELRKSGENALKLFLDYEPYFPNPVFKLWSSVDKVLQDFKQWLREVDAKCLIEVEVDRLTEIFLRLRVNKRRPELLAYEVDVEVPMTLKVSVVDYDVDKILSEVRYWWETSMNIVSTISKMSDILIKACITEFLLATHLQRLNLRVVKHVKDVGKLREALKDKVTVLTFARRSRERGEVYINFFSKTIDNKLVRRVRGEEIRLSVRSLLQIEPCVGIDVGSDIEKKRDSTVVPYFHNVVYLGSNVDELGEVVNKVFQSVKTLEPEVEVVVNQLLTTVD